MVITMDCKEFEKLIPSFLEQRMDYQTLKHFIDHANECAECKEELTIQFLVTEGITRLEDGSSFDMQKELTARMNTAKAKIRRNDFFLSFGVILELFAVMGIVGFVIWMLL